MEFTHEELVWLLRCLNKIVSGPNAPTPDEILRLTGATEEQLVALRDRIDNHVVPAPAVGDRHVVIRHAALDLRNYSGPYLVEEWDGTAWCEVGWAATQDELRAMGCAPPNIESMPGYAQPSRDD